MSLLRSCLFFTSLVVAHPALAGASDARDAGRELYEDLCISCHGEGARGEPGAGSDIRGSIARQVTMAIGGGYEDMPAVELTDDEIAALVAYLDSL